MLYPSFELLLESMHQSFSEWLLKGNLRLMLWLLLHLPRVGFASLSWYQLKLDLILMMNCRSWVYVTFRFFVFEFLRLFDMIVVVMIHCSATLQVLIRVVFCKVIELNYFIDITRYLILFNAVINSALTKLTYYLNQLIWSSLRIWISLFLVLLLIV